MPQQFKRLSKGRGSTAETKISGQTFCQISGQFQDIISPTKR